MVWKVSVGQGGEGTRALGWGSNGLAGSSWEREMALEQIGSRWMSVARKLAVSIPRFALTPSEAAAAIGVGPDFFDANVAPHLRLIRRGRKRLVPVSELERWVAENAEMPMLEQLS